MSFSKVKKWTVYIGFLLLFTCIVAEVALRIYNPFDMSVTGDRITLRTNISLAVKPGNGTNGLDELTMLKRNSLGFRGEDPPKDFKDHLTIVAVGGSTTECAYIDEGKTWPDLLSRQLHLSFDKIWINNAGFNGHSTYGHLKLMKDYIIKLKPDCCLFLVGCNDVDRPDISSFDSTINNDQQTFIVRLARHSRLVNVLLNFYRQHEAVQRQLVTNNNIHFSLKGKEKRILGDSTISEKANEQSALIKQYGVRVQQLIDLCRQSNIEPVFVTQPCLLGDTTDDVTGVDLSTFPMNNGNGKLTWALLQLYNDETKAVCAANKVLVIDLGTQLPKSSRYFYDVYHYNNEGCRKVSSLIYEGLATHLAAKYPKHRRQ